MRIAAVGDIHFTEGLAGVWREQYARLGDVLLLAGDLSNMGRPSEIEALLDDLSAMRVPVVAVLGNHDHQSDAVQVIPVLIEDRGVHLLARLEQRVTERARELAALKQSSYQEPGAAR